MLEKKTQEALSAAKDAIDKCSAALEENSAKISQTDIRVDRLEKIAEAQARDIAGLQVGVRELRNGFIRAAIARGVPTHIVADAHGLTSGRISQIAPRKNRSPLC